MSLIKYIITLFILGTFSPISAQWKKIETIPPAYKSTFWLDVYFLEKNPNFGWVCGYGGNVLRTTDAGLTWSGVKISSLVIDTTYINGNPRYDTTVVPRVNQLESIHFASETVGFTSGEDMMFKSTDGGISWEKVSGPNMSIWGTFFINENVGLGVGGGCEGTQNFHRTSDGGKTWQTFLANEQNTGLSDAMIYSEDGLGWASSSGWIWKTTNGGRSWYKFYYTGDEDWQEEITNINNTFLVPYSLGCSGGGSFENKGGGLRMTTDSWKTWKEYEVGASMFGAFLLDTLRGWGCGDKKNIHYTSDGGISWELRNCGIEDNSQLDDIWFVTDSLGWVVGNGVYKTHYYDTTRAKILHDLNLKICYGDSLQLFSKDDYIYYRWSTGDTTKSIYAHEPGLYILEVYDEICDFRILDSVRVELFPQTVIDLQMNSLGDLCAGDSVSVWVNNKYWNIKWSTNDKLDTIKIKESGNYYVTIIDTNGCEWSKTFEVVFNPLPVAEIQVINKTAFCDGDSTRLKTSRKFSTYHWFEQSNYDSLISNDESILVKSAGSYAVIVTNEFGCVDTSDFISIEVWDMSNRLEISSTATGQDLVFDTLSLTKMQCKELRIHNQSDANVYLNDIILLHNVEFSIPKAQLPLIVAPGEIVFMDVCFRPLGKYDRRDTIIVGDTCSTHSIPLLGWGKPNVYEGLGDCDVNIKFITDTLMGDEFFKSSMVYPNPSEGLINIKVTDKIDSKPFYILRNNIGNIVDKGFIELVNLSINEEKSRITGTLTLDFKIFSNGLYFLEIQTTSGVKCYPIMLRK